MADNIDDLIRQMQEDEERDQIEQATLAKPIKYARSRGIAPQRVYAALRSGSLQKVQCPCGSLCVDIHAADTHFGFEKEVDEDAEEVVDGNLDV